MKLGNRLPIETLSATSLAKAVQCPEAWRQRYILRYPESFGVERFVGEVDHTTYENYFSEKMKGQPWSLPLLESAFEYNWHTTLEKYDPQWKEDPEQLMERSRKMIQTYFETAQEIEPVAVEQKFEETIPGVSIPVIGYLDLETRAKVIERKTSKSKLSSPKPTWKFQARVYQLVNRKPIEWHVVTKQATPQIVTGIIQNVQNPDDTVRLIQQVVHTLDDYYTRYGPNNPWPTIGVMHEWACSYCAHRKTCVAWQGVDWS